MTPEEALHVIEESARLVEAMADFEVQREANGWPEAAMRYRAHAAACREAAATLRPPEGCVFVAVTRELLPHLGEWSEPVRVKVARYDGRVAALMFERMPTEALSDSEAR